MGWQYRWSYGPWLDGLFVIVLHLGRDILIRYCLLFQCVVLNGKLESFLCRSLYHAMATSKTYQMMDHRMTRIILGQNHLYFHYSWMEVRSCLVFALIFDFVKFNIIRLNQLISTTFGNWMLFHFYFQLFLPLDFLSSLIFKKLKGESLSLPPCL